MTDLEKLREGIALAVNKFLGDHIRKAVGNGLLPPDGSGFIDQILALTDAYYKEKYEGYVQLAKDQSLPSILTSWIWRTSSRKAYKQGQQSMVKGDSTGVWRKVEMKKDNTPFCFNCQQSPDKCQCEHSTIINREVSTHQ